jgi:hypothetical protein
MGCYNPPPSKGILSRDLKESKRRTRFVLVTLMEGTQGSWIVGSPHVPTWLYPLSDHSIEPCKTGWSYFE